MLEFEVVPGYGLRSEQFELLLGTPINQVINILQDSYRLVDKVEIAYSASEPLAKDIIIRLPTDGIRLYFEPTAQLLRLIEVYDLSNITLRSCTGVFSRPGEEADVFKAEAAFGATHPGVYDEQQRLYELNWRGLSFCFPAHKDTSTLQISYVKGTRIGSLQFVNSPPMLVKMAIFKGQSATPNGAAFAYEIIGSGAALAGTFSSFPVARSNFVPLRMPSCPDLMVCGMCLPLSIKSVNENGRIRGLDISFSAQERGPITSRGAEFPLKDFERRICFGDTTEVVLSALGAPSNVNYRSAEKMMVRRGNESERLREMQPHFFFNYFSLGLDILFNYHTNRVEKFVLHTNIPGHYDFGMYARCNFSIVVGADLFVLTSTSKRDQFLSAFSDNDDEVQPVVLNRNASENIFDSTFCYGTDQLIVEVMKNGLISSVTIFK